MHQLNASLQTYAQRRLVEITGYTGYLCGVVVTQWINVICCKTRRNSIIEQGMRQVQAYHLPHPLNITQCSPFIHSLIHFRYLYSASSRFLLRGAPDYSADTESEFHAEAHEQLRVKDLPRVPTRGLEVDSNPQPSGCKAPNIPLHHRAPRSMTKKPIRVKIPDLY